MQSKQAFRECAVFDSLSDADLDKVVSLSQPTELAAGVTLFTEGSPAKDIYVLEKGKIALQMQLPQVQPHLTRRITVDVMSKGELVGWSAVVEPYRYTFTAVCLEPCQLHAVDGAKLRTLLRDDHKVGYVVLSRLIRIVASRLDETRHVLISERLATSQ